MDNRLNELRRKIITLRLNMLDMAASVREQVNHDRDCAESSLRLMGMRQELTALAREWTLLGGGERLPTIQERLRENYRPVQKPKAAPKQRTPTKQKVEKAALLDDGEQPTGLSVRHCERSEAIHLATKGKRKNGLLRFARNDC